ncbi:monovalent cation/H(+) antiporter subunit G [Puniceicoccales bacterium CK1056]|uniref:Monovalent cation/H(+) antiporter subunit G n=1 Tax=Oceanipulchritudo coccoides TaxID=2706888 RepID=A0A6B2M459_9BACT|nr:monovalent cation/H(+) antiporter subunit G [Oceanipulchritudo coccoides]NDV63543.1 monovalent cation/H(+) antiporter subunit G [Oceanipulchritudo coccoides]
MITEILTAFFLVLGSGVILLAAIGILRLPDALCRGHALGKGMTAGLILVLIGLWFYLGIEVAGIKVPLAVIFQFLTIPIASHLLVRQAYRNTKSREQK